MPNAPAVSCAMIVVERTRVTTSTPESPGISARNGFNGFLRALPGDRACLPPSSANMFLSKPGWADLNSANLTPASGRQDHTTSPYAASISRPRAVNRSQAFRQPTLRSRRAQNAAASTASHPASVTIMIRPSGGVGWREFVEMICPTGEAKYFCKGDWTGKSPDGQITGWCRLEQVPQPRGKAASPAILNPCRYCARPPSWVPIPYRS
jgi:hypothetical protein